MPPKVINVYKKCGQTPLDCINEVKKANPEMTHLPLTYAGRLDPLAEGVLLILVGDECLKKDDYLSLPKEYELTILFGFETDTYDLMGKVQISDTILQVPDNCNNSCRVPEEVFSEVQPTSSFEYCTSEKIQEIIPTFIGRINQAYPPYSSRTVDGKPLFQWAREGKLDKIIIPSHDVFVENIEIIKEDFISGAELLEKIKKDIGSVKGDFRQDEILSIWRDKLKNELENKYQTLKLKVSCGSGVYVRSIAHELGKKLGVPALALNIKRTRVGEYEIN